MEDKYTLQEYYITYLKRVRKVKQSSIAHYLQALRKVSGILIEKEKIKETIYEIKDINELKCIIEFLYNDPSFIALDERGHRMYSAGLNNYYRFAKGEDFSNMQNDIVVMDVEISKSKKSTNYVEYWNRSSIIKRQCIKAANYKCEIDNNHETFIAKSTGEQYMEGHHAIPMNRQDYFDVSLDVYANIVSLCPICHRLLHHAENHIKENVANQIYYERSDRLAKSGIRLSRDEFIENVL